MHEQWKELEEFPGYAVSNTGYVKSLMWDKLLRISQNQSGTACVGMMKDGVQQHRSVALLVIGAWGYSHVNENFDTPINLDGNRMNNSISNLMWRPRWYAVKYNRQFTRRYAYPIVTPVIDIDTMEISNDSLDAAMRYGLLEKEVVMSIANQTITWPTGQRFQIVPE